MFVFFLHLLNKQLKLPNADLDVDLKYFIKIICSILDIPIIDNNPLHSLHVLFDLFSGFFSILFYLSLCFIAFRVI